MPLYPNFSQSINKRHHVPPNQQQNSNGQNYYPQSTLNQNGNSNNFTTQAQQATQLVNQSVQFNLALTQVVGASQNTTFTDSPRFRPQNNPSQLYQQTYEKPSSTTASSKLVSLLQSHSILPQSRESAGGLSHSSKKHRELKRAQELSSNIAAAATQQTNVVVRQSQQDYSVLQKNAGNNNNTQVTPSNQTSKQHIQLNKSAMQTRSLSREKFQEEIVQFVESQAINISNTNKENNNSSSAITIKGMKSGSASTQFRRGSERQPSKRKDNNALSQTRQNTEKFESQSVHGSNTPIASQQKNNLMLSSQFENSSNRDIESDLSGNEYDGKDFNDQLNKANDNLSEVSEESAFEEEDDEYFADTKNPKDGSKGSNQLDQNNVKFKEDLLNCDEDSKQQPENGTKKKKVSIRILASMPKNAKEEEEKFFESNCQINPQFEYDNPSVAARFINQFKKPRSDLLPFAQKIMDAFLQHYGSESSYLLTEGRVITDQEETESIFKKYLEELDVLEVAVINFSDKIVAPTSVTYDNYSSKIKINIQVPVEYREGRIMGVLHHEIGTHFLRRLNETQQVWHLKRKKYGLKSCIAIEEGMGCIHMMLEQSKDINKKPYLFKPALNYYACYKASELSFAELFSDLEKYVDNPRKRWKYVLRVKRGLSDTSQPGGLYKDQVYLEGAIKILKNRRDINFKLLYAGKLNIEDLKRPKFIKQVSRLSDIYEINNLIQESLT